MYFRAEPTSRVTRQQSRTNVRNPDPLSFDPGEGTSAQARNQSGPVDTDSEDEHLRRLRRLRTPTTVTDAEPSVPPAATTPSTPATEETQDPFDGHTPADPNLAPCQCEPPSNPTAPCNAGPPRFFTKNSQRKFSKQPTTTNSRPDGPTNPPATQQRTLSFSRPKPGNFSYRRKPDVNAFFNIIHDHLNS